MSNENPTKVALVPVEQKEVLFYNDQLTAVQMDDGGVYVPVRAICDLIGVDWSSQRQRINRDAVLSQELVPCVVVTTTQGQPDQRRDVLCLPLKYIPGWLFGINANRVKEELRDKIIQYQRECYEVLAQAFENGRLTTDIPFSELLSTADPDVVQAYQIAQAVVTLARNQILLEAKLTSRMDSQQGQIDEHGTRIQLIEATLGDPKRHISEAQATDINQAVRSIALVLSERSGRVEYGACWGEFYRKFGVAKYRFLPAIRYDEAMKWLGDWYAALTSDIPF